MTCIIRHRDAQSHVVSVGCRSQPPDWRELSTSRPTSVREDCLPRGGPGAGALDAFGVVLPRRSGLAVVVFGVVCPTGLPPGDGGVLPGCRRGGGERDGAGHGDGRPRLGGSGCEQTVAWGGWSSGGGAVALGLVGVWLCGLAAVVLWRGLRRGQ